MQWYLRPDDAAPPVSEPLNHDKFSLIVHHSGKFRKNKEGEICYVDGKVNYFDGCTDDLCMQDLTMMTYELKLAGIMEYYFSFNCEDNCKNLVYISGDGNVGEIPCLVRFPAPTVDERLPLRPPKVQVMPGRPKKHKRKLEQGEIRGTSKNGKLKKRILNLTCHTCNQQGHNSRGCPLNQAKKQKMSESQSQKQEQKSTPLATPTPVTEPESTHIPVTNPTPVRKSPRNNLTESVASPVRRSQRLNLNEPPVASPVRRSPRNLSENAPKSPLRKSPLKKLPVISKKKVPSKTVHNVTASQPSAPVASSQPVADPPRASSQPVADAPRASSQPSKAPLSQAELRKQLGGSMIKLRSSEEMRNVDIKAMMKTVHARRGW